MTFDALKSLIAKSFPPISFTRQNTVLLLIDMQKLLTVDRIVEATVEKGAAPEEAREALKDYGAALQASLEQARKVLLAFREKDMTPIHVKIESYAGDARDTSFSHRMSNYLLPPGSRWAAFFDEVKPLPGEIVLPKTCSGAVIGTNLDRVLRNLKAENVISVGYYTDQCVETTIRDLADLGYLNFLVTDATLGSTEKKYQNAIENIGGVYCRFFSADEAARRIAAL
jgi:nicotinamidase-related amidase